MQGASAQLTRTKNGISYVFSTTELEPGVHTMWIVAFNDSSACEGGCGADDLIAGRGDSAAFWDGGLVVGPDGRAILAGHVQENRMPSQPAKILKDNTGGVGIGSSETTEVHLVLRSHGPAIIGGNGLSTQLNSFNGGCQPAPDSCKNVQFSVH